MRLDCAMSWGKTLLPYFADLDEIQWNVGREKMKESPFFPIGQASTKCANVIFGNVAQYLLGVVRRI